MPAIQESQWNQVTIYTWGDLSSNLWEDFRLALYENEVEMSTQGVSIKQSSSKSEISIETEVQGVKVVQSSAIVTQQSEMIVSIVVSVRDYKTEMIKYLPLYERKSNIIHEVLKVSDIEFRNTEQQLEVVGRNVFIDTAIEYLPMYERDLGINSVETLNYKQRRELISSRNKAVFGQTTEETIRTVTKTFTNGDVRVVQTETPGVFEVHFIDVIGIPDNIDGLKETLEVILPAHLEFSYVFIFNAWNFIQGKTWDDASVHTWDQLRNEVF